MLAPTGPFLFLLMSRARLMNSYRIGRITENLLLKVASEVDVLEPVEKLTDAIKGTPGVRHIFNVGLEDWKPDEDVKYDLIWTQWCLCYLTEQQIIDYLQVCKGALSATGVIVVKENLSTTGQDHFDETDSSTTRSVCTFAFIYGWIF